MGYINNMTNNQSSSSSSNTEEIWKQVIVNNEEYDYEVSNYGNIRNKKKQHLKASLRDGYDSIYFNYKKKMFKIHRLVALMFIPNNNPEVNNIVNHIDGNKLNNHYTNLEWTTASGNVQHAIDNNLINVTKRRVTQCDLEGNEIKIFDSLDEAKKVTGIDDGAIAKVCKGTRKTAGKFIWKYTDINENEIELDKVNLEDYIPVKDFPNYIINKEGKVYSVPYKKFIKSKPNRTGSEQLQLTDKSNRKTFLLHNLVADHFLDIVPNKDFVLHINHDKSDNRVENLKRATLSEVNYHNKCI